MKINEGQKVICISEDFPLIKKYGGTGKEAEKHPKKGEILIVDEILGEFLRFDKYDSNESWNWWKYDRFVPFNESKGEVVNDYNFTKRELVKSK